MFKISKIAPTECNIGFKPQSTARYYVISTLCIFVLHTLRLACDSRHSPVFLFFSYSTMSAGTNTFENVKAVILSAHESSTTREKLNFYNSWAQNYDQVWEMKLSKRATSGNILGLVLNMKWKFIHVLFGLIGCGPPGLPCISPGSKQYFNTLPRQSFCSGGVGRCLWYRTGVQRGTFTR